MIRNIRPLTSQILRSDSFWTVNKTMFYLVGMESVFLLSSFADAECMLADEDGWFYQTSETVEKITLLSRHKQDRCISKLEKMGILEKDVRGLPPKRYFRINHDVIQDLIAKNSQINIQITDNSISENMTTNKEYSNKEYNIKDTMHQDKKDNMDYEHILSIFKEYCKNLPQPRKLTGSRKKVLKAWGDVEEMEEVFKLVGESNFLQGLDNQGNQTGKWVATFDWIIKPSNRVKILEGNYKNKGGKCETVTGYDFTDEII